MELNSDKPGMIHKLDNFDQVSVRGETGKPDRVRGEFLPIIVIEFVSVPMALMNELTAVYIV